MKKINQDIPKIINEDQILEVFETSWQKLSIDWMELLLHWLNGSYKIFRDHEKYLILIFIVKKTFDKYSENFTSLTYEEFYSLNKIEIKKINIVEISKELNISRETARRKISELEKLGVIQKTNKTFIVREKTHSIQKTETVIKLVCAFLSKFSHIIKEKNLINKEFNKDKAESILLLKFSYVWKLWFEMLIPLLKIWKNVYGDLETFHVIGLIIINQTYATNNYLKKNNLPNHFRSQYLTLLADLKDQTGINAMTISNLTGIPRATVIRKLRKLISNNVLNIDKKKLYHLDSSFVKTAIGDHEINLRIISIFITKVINLINFNQNE